MHLQPDMSHVYKHDVVKIKGLGMNIAWNRGDLALTILAAEPVDGPEEAVVQLRRPAEARVL